MPKKEGRNIFKAVIQQIVMAKILLIQPNLGLTGRGQRPCDPPLSLIYLGTAIKKKHQVKIFDRDLNPKDENLIRVLKEYSPEIIGITSMTSQMLFDIIHIGPIIRGHLPKAIVVVGGVHATVEPDSVLNEPYVDYIIRGEGEEAFLEFCDVFNRNPKKLGKLENVNKNPLRPLIDLNTLERPDFSLIDLKAYGPMWINTSRGCPGNCSFCYNSKMWGKNGRPCVRFFNTKKTIELFRDVIENQGRTEFNISDDNFVTFKQRCLEVCKFLEQKYAGKISFLCAMRADRVDDEILSAIKKAGCNSIVFGSESGSQKTLNFLNKQISVEAQGKAIELCHKHGIFSWDSLMFGIPGETMEDLNFTKKFVKKYNPDKIMVHIFTAMPGTAIFEDLVKKGVIKKPKTLLDWAKYIDGYSFHQLKHNRSMIPDSVLKRTVKEFTEYKEYRTKIKKFFWWVKKGKIKYVFKRLRSELN
jgi:radical SAM superfamily enzyme YgiQ (UPF0313 family)